MMDHLTDDAIQLLVEGPEYPAVLADLTERALIVTCREPGEAEFAIRYSLKQWDEETKCAKTHTYERAFGTWERHAPNPEWHSYNAKMAQGHAAYLLLKARQNQDPFADDDYARGSKMTFGDFLDEFIKRHHQEKTLAPRTLYRYQRYIDGTIKTILGDIPLFKLDRTAISDFHRKVSVQDGPISDASRHWGGRITANRQLALIKNALARAVEWGYLDLNPAQSVRRFKESSREMWGNEEELVRLMRLLEEDLALGKKRYRSSIDGIRLALLTGARKQELLHIEKRYIEFKQTAEGEIAVWRKPPEFAKSKRWEVSILSPIAAKIVRARLRDFPESKWLFASPRNPNEALHDFDGWKHYRQRAGCEHLHFHDLRHTASTHAVMSGANIYTVSKGLDHRSIKTTERYTHADLRAKQEAAQHFGKNMARWLERAKEQTDTPENDLDMLERFIAQKKAVAS